MSQTSSFNRMPRIQELLPQGEVKLPGPPSIGPPPKFNWFLTLLPVAGILIMVGLYGALYKNWMLALPMLAMSGVSVTTSVVGTLTQRKNQKKDVAEKEAAYAAALKQKRADLEHLRQEQQRIRASVDPDLAALLARARTRDSRLWERRPADADFLSVRLGLGALPSTVVVSAPHPDMPDPRLAEAHAIEAEYAALPQVPVTASLCTGPLGIAGPVLDRTGVARALACNVAVHHSPDEVHLLAIYSPDRMGEWQWLKWLPHTYALNEEAGRRYLADDSFSAQELLKDLLEELHRRQNQLYAAQHGGGVPAWPWLMLLVENYALVCNDPAIHLLLSPPTLCDRWSRAHPGLPGGCNDSPTAGRQSPGPKSSTFVRESKSFYRGLTGAAVQKAIHQCLLSSLPCNPLLSIGS